MKQRDKVFTPGDYVITLEILNLVAESSETVGRYSALTEQDLAPRLRRENRLRSIQASLAIENNYPDFGAGDGSYRGQAGSRSTPEIQQVCNAFAAYEEIENWNACSEADLLAAHALLMQSLVEMENPPC